MLADLLGAELILEKAETNPFLADFYGDKGRWALQTQLAFLITRHQQQVSVRQMNLFHQKVVADYILEKDAIFARLTLDEREYKLYQHIANYLSNEAATPDLVVFLQSSPERLLTNINIRDIKYEREITQEYLEQLCETYNHFFKSWTKCPLLVVNASLIDFVHCPEDQRKLVDRILTMPEVGRVNYPEV